MIEIGEDAENRETHKDDIDEVGKFSSIKIIRNSQEPEEGWDHLLLKLLLLLHNKKLLPIPNDSIKEYYLFPRIIFSTSALACSSMFLIQFLMLSKLFSLVMS